VCVCVREERGIGVCVYEGGEGGRTEWGWRGEGGMGEDLRKVGGRKEDGRGEGERDRNGFPFPPSPF